MATPGRDAYRKNIHQLKFYRPGRTGENSSSSNTCAQEGCDETISFFEQIPDGLLEIILCRLSVLEVMQMRCLSKRWRNLIDFPVFLNMYDEKYAEPCFLVHWMREKEHSICAYFPLVDKWKFIPASAIQPQKSLSCTRARGSMSGPSPLNMYGSERGIWCIYSKECGPFKRETGRRRRYRSLNHEINTMTLSVHNPLSGWCSFLPSYPNPQLRYYPESNAVSVLVTASGRSFKVLCAGIHDHDTKERCPEEEGKCVSTVLFDSASMTWKQVADLPFSDLRFRGDDSREVCRAESGSVSYFVTQREEELMLLSFDHGLCSWNIIPGRMPSQRKAYMYDSITLSETRGLLILTFRTEPIYQLLPRFLGHLLFPHIFAWDLTASPHVQVWNEIPLPEPPLPRISSEYLHLLYTFRWHGKGDFLFFTCSDLWGMGALVFNLTSKSWRLTISNSDELPAPKVVRPQTVAVELHLSTVINLRAEPFAEVLL